jgi:hypothetical protein
MFETVTPKLNDVFGCLTNLSYCAGGIICAAIGLSLDDSQDGLKQDKIWRLINGFPMVFAFLQTILCLTLFRSEPIDFLI